MTSMKYVAGVDCGSTQVVANICTTDGRIFAEKETPVAKNSLEVPLADFVCWIGSLVKELLVDVGLTGTRLSCIGLAISGVDDSKRKLEAEAVFMREFSEFADFVIVENDTVGAVFAVSPIGGLAVIAGTGSNALLINPDGSVHQCGGWGMWLGDEGSAFFIAHKAVKTCIGHLDQCLYPSDYPVVDVWEVIKRELNAPTIADVNRFYDGPDFTKSRIASLCRLLAGLAFEGDPLCKSLFVEAGYHLGRHVVRLIPKTHADLHRAGDLKIVCIGGVFRAFALLEPGFRKALEGLPHCVPDLTSVTLVRINRSSAYGMAFLAAQRSGTPFDGNFDGATSELISFKLLAKTERADSHTDNKACVARKSPTSVFMDNNTDLSC